MSMAFIINSLILEIFFSCLDVELSKDNLRRLEEICPESGGE